MPLIALFYIVLAAVAHAFWNFLAKRHADCRHIIFFSSAGEVLILLPILASTKFTYRNATAALICLFATGALHILYTESLLRGYRSADLSIVYPLARGSGPLLAFAGAIPLLNERFTVISVAGTLLIAYGILVVCGGMKALIRHDARAGVRWGVTTGLTIAAYTLVDGYAVAAVGLSPFLIEFAGSFFRMTGLSVAFGRTLRQDRSAIAGEYRECWKAALGISILMPAAYILVLYAMRIAPVSHVAPAREMSMLIGAWMGARLLKEGNVARRVAGSCLIGAGVAALAIH